MVCRVPQGLILCAAVRRPCLSSVSSDDTLRARESFPRFVYAEKTLCREAATI